MLIQLYAVKMNLSPVLIYEGHLWNQIEKTNSTDLWWSQKLAGSLNKIWKDLSTLPKYTATL